MSVLDVHALTTSLGLGDREKILPFVLPGFVIDVGCGIGTLASRVAEETGSYVLGVDCDPRVLLEVPRNVRTREGHALSTLRRLKGSGATSIILSNVLCEIYSAGEGDPQAAGRLFAVRAVLNAAWEALAPGGRLIVRDGVRTRDDKEIVLHDPYGFVERFKIDSPFYENTRAEVKIAPFERIGPATYRTRESSVTEVALSATWGASVWPFEVRKTHALYSRDNFERLARFLGFAVTHSEEYQQEGYREHFARIGYSLPLVPTNALYALTKEPTPTS